MKVTFTRTGGFGGIKLATTVDAAALPLQERERLLGLIGQLKSEHIETKPDQFHYSLTINDGTQRTVKLGDSPANDELVEYFMDKIAAAI